jgi:hypothetical protein
MAVTVAEIALKALAGGVLVLAFAALAQTLLIWAITAGAAMVVLP